MKPRPSAPSPSQSPVPNPQSPVSHPISLLRYWLPVVLWCLVIFGASADSKSTQRTSRFIGPLVRWLIPGATDATVRGVQFVVRKTAHAAEYALLALLVWRALRRPRRGDNRPWHWREAILAFAFATLFAVSDEWHQAYVPNRQGHPGDVILDSTGAALGLLGLRAWGRWRKRW